MIYRKAKSRWFTKTVLALVISLTTFTIGSAQNSNKVRRSYGSYGYIDKSGSCIIRGQFAQAKDFSSGLAAVRIGHKWGFISYAGKFVVKARYDEAGTFSEGKAGINLDGKWGYINRYGRIVVKNVYEKAYGFSNGLAGVRFSQKWGFINHCGKLVVPFLYDFVRPFSEGVAIVTKGDENIIIDQSGRVVDTLKFSDHSNMNNGFICVGKRFKVPGRLAKERRFGLYSRDGRIVDNRWYDWVGDFSEGLAYVRIMANRSYQDCCWGFIDDSGRMVIRKSGKLTWLLQRNSESELKFREGLAPICVNRSWGYINRAGKLVIKPQFSIAKPFNEGVALVAKSDTILYGFIDCSGNYVIEPIYGAAQSFSEGLAVVLCE